MSSDTPNCSSGVTVVVRVIRSFPHRNIRNIVLRYSSSENVNTLLSTFLSLIFQRCVVGSVRKWLFKSMHFLCEIEYKSSASLQDICIWLPEDRTPSSWKQDLGPCGQHRDRTYGSQFVTQGLWNQKWNGTITFQVIWETSILTSKSILFRRVDYDEYRAGPNKGQTMWW